MDNIRRILSPMEVTNLINALERLAKVSAALGYPEDEQHYRAMIKELKGGIK